MEVDKGEEPYPRFLLFGDSIAERAGQLSDGYCFTAALHTVCRYRLDVVNRGIGGYNSNQALTSIDRIIPPPSQGRIKFLLILFGANDACLPTASTKQHVPRKEYFENICRIMRHPSITAHKPKIILVTPPPIDEIRCEASKLGGEPGEVLREAAVTKAYAEGCRGIGAYIAETEDLVVVDLWNAIMNEAIKSTPGYKPADGLVGSKETGSCQALADLLPDGLHFSGKAYEIFFNEVMEAIRTKWPNEGPDSGPLYFPRWTEAPKSQ